MNMKRLAWWALFVILMQALVVLAQKAELRLPSVTIGKSVYSNAVLTVTRTNRIAVEHQAGMASIKTANLDVDLAQQLLSAGVIDEKALKDNKDYQAKLKQDKQAEKQRQRGSQPQGVVAQYAGMEGSMGARLGEALEREVNARGGIDPEQYIARFGLGVVIAILGGAVFYYFLKCWCLFRIVKKSLGEGSWLIILPLIRWFSLVQAAGMSRHWLWLPVLGLGMLFCQPPMPERLPWAGMAYLYLTIAVWAITALLFAVWCVKICQKAGGNSLLGLLLIIPLLEWVALFYLAFSGGGDTKITTSSKGKPGANRPVFAVV